MLYYIAMSWNSFESAKCMTARRLIQDFMAEARGWTATLDCDGLFVACHVVQGPNIARPYVLQQEQGVVLGTLFHRDYASRADTHQVVPTAVELGARESDRIASSGARHLIDAYWGQYVAFVRSRGGGEIHVLRDPTGAVPCQWMQIRGIDVYFVRLEDCERLRSESLSINKHFIRGYLMFDSACVTETGLNEIETVLPGECIRHSGGERTRTFYWDPLRIANENAFENVEEAGRAMRSTVRACVHAWASCFKGIAHQLSGGLDSSIVASCLADAPTRPRVVCRNLHAPDPGSDERSFARLVAKQAGLELIERPAATGFSLAGVRDVPRNLMPFPWWTTDLSARSEEIEFFRSRGLDAQFNGNGGDELFHVGGMLPSAVDFSWCHPLSLRVFVVALEDAALEGRSMWDVMRLVRDFGVRRRPWYVHHMFRKDLRPTMLREVREEGWRDWTHWHPLFRSASPLPPVKYSQAYLFAFGASAVHCPRPGPLRVQSIATAISPLKSQPFLELSLRTPVYVLRAGGRDRGLARHAFADDVPRAVIERKSKAYANSQVQGIFQHNLPLLRELLLDGFLVRERFVDRAGLEHALSGDPTVLQSRIPELATYLSVEGWAGEWRRYSARSAAA